MSDKERITVLERNRALTQEELAVELTPSMPKNVVPFNRNVEEEERFIETKEEKASEKSGMALTGVILSVLSLFFLPYLLAPAGIILGYIGYKKGDHSLGMWSMGIGVIGLFGTLIVSSFIF